MQVIKVWYVFFPKMIAYESLSYMFFLLEKYFYNIITKSSLFWVLVMVNCRNLNTHIHMFPLRLESSTSHCQEKNNVIFAIR